MLTIFFGGLATIVTPTGGSTALTFLNLLDTRATTANVNIKKNIFGSTTANNITTTNSSATAFSYTGISISQTGTSLTINADSNTFRNTAMTASTINLIRNTYASSSTNTSLFTMNANVMTDISTTGASASITGLNYTNNSTATNNIQTIQLHDNVLGNISVGSGTAGNLRGFLVNNAANSIGIGLKGRITGNQLSTFNNLATGTGQTGGIFVVHEMVVTDSLVIANNNVNNLVHAGSGVITTVRGNVTGISVDAPLSSSMFNAPGLAVIRDNQVSNLQATTTAANAVRSQGISVYGNKTVVERNKVNNLANTATLSTATIVPLFLNTGADDLNNILMVRNNMFAINNNTTASQTGIAMGGGTVRANIYHNSILVEGSSTTNSYAILKAGGSQVDIANNILYNATTGSGAAYAIGLGTNANGYLGNNNYFVSPAGAALAEIGTTPHTLASWQAATGDDGATQTAVSGITTNADDLFIGKATANLFINTSHPTEPAKASNLGMPLSASVPSDFAGIIRSISTPDIGAQEFIFSGTLPLNLISFSGSKQNNDALLQWRTTNEVNVSHFELQRSEDGITFTTIANVPAGSSSYRYADAGVFNTKQLVLYRLKSVDIDGRFTLSPVVRLQKTVSGNIVLYPNPATDVITISGLQQNSVIILFSADGKLLTQQKVNTQSTTLDLRNYPIGMYILSYRYEGGLVIQRIIKK